MLLIYIALYLVILLVVWGFFAVARMHILKFRNFSTHIIPVTNFLLVFLIVLSVIGFVLLFFLNPDVNTYDVSTQSNTVSETIAEWDSNSIESGTKKKTLPQEVIWEEFY